MNQTNPRPHADLIKLWADGAEIEYNNNGVWTGISRPLWSPEATYRVKPERVFPKSSLSYNDLCDLVNAACAEHRLIGSKEGHYTFIARLAADAAVKQYILDTEKK